MQILNDAPKMIMGFDMFDESWCTGCVSRKSFVDIHQYEIPTNLLLRVF